MRKRTMKIRCDSSRSNECIITINNIGLERENMKKIVKIIQRFTKGEKFFFGFYRKDGINLSREEWEKYGEEIPEHFRDKGTYEPLAEIIEKKGKQKTYSGYLTVGCLPVNDETYELIPWIFHYHLETILFCPKIDWETFVQSYRDYMRCGVSDYIMNEYADFLFIYADSGDFSVEFNSNLFDKNVVYQEITKILSDAY